MTYLPLRLLISIAVLTGCLPTANKADSTVDDSTIKQDIVVGDLGGVPLDMPRDRVHLVEYNCDPSWGKTWRA